MTMKNFFKPSALVFSMLAASTSFAGEIYKDDAKQLNLNIDSWVGVFNSQENYYETEKDGSQWTEGFIKYGLSGSINTPKASSLYAGVAGVTSFVRGDGDMGGNTNGEESKTSLENAYIGWKSGNVFSVLGENGLDISFGQQVFHLGDGFLVTDDSANLGKHRGYDEAGADMVNRGGAYYTAARRAFKNTAVVKIGQAEGFKTELAWVQSDNPIHASSEFAALDLNYTKGANTIGFDYVKFLDYDQTEATYLNPTVFMRDKMDVYSVRGSTNAGVENLTLNFNYSQQFKDKNVVFYEDETYEVFDKKHDDNAFYAGIGYHFVNAPLAPSVNYRYTRYSEGWDPMFVGVEKLGTWIYGEVAGNFAGPFNTNSAIHSIGIEAFPTEKLLLGANIYNFETLEKAGGDQSGQELDLFAFYQVNEALALIPVLGIYKPKKSFEEGGTQFGNDKTNVFAALIAAVSF